MEIGLFFAAVLNVNGTLMPFGIEQVGTYGDYLACDDVASKLILMDKLVYEADQTDERGYQSYHDNNSRYFCAVVPKK